MSSAKQPTRKFYTPRRLALTFLVLSLVALFAASGCNSTDETVTRNPARKPAPNPPAAPNGAPVLPAAVRDVEMKALVGTPIKLSDYNNKVLLLNLWATWCGPCRMEIPELVKLYNEFHSQGFEVVGLSTEDPEASVETVRSFVQSFNMDYRVGWVTPQVAVPLVQGRDSIPQSFIISRDGRILRRFVGFSAANTPPQLRQAIEEALNEKSSD
jgi:glutathione peroxidase-family protein